MVEKKIEKRGLGRGLSALIGDTLAPEPGDGAGTPARGLGGTLERQVPIEFVEPNPDQPRRDFDADDLQSLADSIREKGVLQPLLVRKGKKQGHFQIIAGERRWRAAQMAQLHQVPVLERDYSDREVLEIGIIENMQRADLNPIEEALGFRALIDKYHHTQDEVSKALAKSRSYIANQLRLLQLPAEVQEMLRSGALTTGHARAIITADDPVGLARKIITGGLSVRAAERLGKGDANAGAAARKPRGETHKDADTLALEKDLSATTGMKVGIEPSKGGQSGQMTIAYSTLDDLDDLCQALNGVNKLAR